MRFFFFFFLILEPLFGHAVKQTYAKFTNDEDGWTLLITHDIGLNGEDAGDPDVPQKPRDYLFTLSPEEHAELREQSQETLRRALKIQPSNYKVSFPDYDQTPFDFPDLRIGGAYLHVKLQGPHPKDQALTLEPLPGPCPLYVIHEGETFQNVKVGEKYALIPTGQGVGGGEGRTSFDFSGFLTVGFLHVLPAGWDHVLFIVGLCLLQLKLRPVLWQSLVFTVAHSITLALAAHGVLPAGGKWVEVIIAASIAAVGFSSMKEAPLNPWRIVLVFGFGLIHGMGFAGALAEPLQESSQFLPALASMNLGVELAQVIVVFLVFGVFAVISRDRPRRYLALFVGLIGVFLTLSRIFEW